MKATIIHFSNFLFYGNVFVSLCAASLTYLNCLFFGVDQFAFHLSLFIFCATNVAYNFQRLFRIRKTNSTPSSARLNWIKKHKTHLLLMNFLLSGLAFYCLIVLPMKVLVILIPIGFISFWYVVDLKSIPAIRSIPFIKLFVIGITWSLSTFGLPLMISNSLYCSKNYAILFLSITFYVILQTIPFDIRDIDYDTELKIKTLAQRLGVKKSKLLSATGFLTLSITFYLISFHELSTQIIVQSYAISSLLATPLILAINPHKKEYYYSGVIESILLFPFLIHLFLSKVF